MEEGDGWVLVTVHNAASGKGELAILDARDVGAGPVATIRLPHFLPGGLHACWTGEVFGAAAGEGEPKWRQPRAWKQL